MNTENNTTKDILTIMTTVQAQVQHWRQLEDLGQWERSLAKFYLGSEVVAC